MVVVEPVLVEGRRKRCGEWKDGDDIFSILMWWCGVCLVRHARTYAKKWSYVVVGKKVGEYGKTNVSSEKVADCSVRLTLQLSNGKIFINGTN